MITVFGVGIAAIASCQRFQPASTDPRAIVEACEISLATPLQFAQGRRYGDPRGAQCGEQSADEADGERPLDAGP